MTGDDGALGVCIVRIEPQPTYLLITITGYRHVGDTVFAARPELERTVADPEQAVAVIARFLASF